MIRKIRQSERCQNVYDERMRYVATLCFVFAMSFGIPCEVKVSAQSGVTPEAMRLMMPGEAHKILGAMAGKWTGRMKVWSSAAPSQPPLESTEESETRLMLGGRFAYEEAKGSLMGMAMQRVSILGYDNYKKVYTLVFYSSMDTATNTASGSLDAAGKVLTLRGEFDEPAGKTPFKNVIRIESDDLHVFESYRIYPDGRELKLIEETFTRVK